eukprot:5600391-Pyramimonas_sp.AAC.1
MWSKLAQDGLIRPATCDERIMQLTFVFGGGESRRRGAEAEWNNRTGEGLDQVTTKARSPSRPERPSACRS